MASYDYGKKEVCEWIRNSFAKGATCLDVGACDGKWADLLGEYLTMDACEIFNANVVEHHLEDKYRSIYVCDIAEYNYAYYDIVLFGDVIEHMSVEKAQEVLRYAEAHSKCIIVGVPMQYKQGELYGNPYEKHIQDDLTPKLMEERYEGLELLLRASDDYYYYVG